MNTKPKDLTWFDWQHKAVESLNPWKNDFEHIQFMDHNLLAFPIAPGPGLVSSSDRQLSDAGHVMK